MWTCDDLATYRRKHGFTQAQFARMLHCDQASVSLWESGKIRPHGPASVLLGFLLQNEDISPDKLLALRSNYDL